jgi:hypothetical protein
MRVEEIGGKRAAADAPPWPRRTPHRVEIQRRAEPARDRPMDAAAGPVHAPPPIWPRVFPGL